MMEGRDRGRIIIGGSAHSFPPFFFLAHPFSLFFCSGGNGGFGEHSKTTQKQTDDEQREALFCQDDNPPTPSLLFSN